ncbi:hypothetical protein BGX38DRAFT_1100670, partial [Terfezia claveryi]
DELHVKDIIVLKLPLVRLAYLSACSTAQSTGSRLVDKVTHIMSSFYIAGFINIIGILWPSQDEACKKIAVNFYFMLSQMDDVTASYHTAIIGLVKKKPAQLIFWAPFIYFGA